MRGLRGCEAGARYPDGHPGVYRRSVSASTGAALPTNLSRGLRVGHVRSPNGRNSSGRWLSVAGLGDLGA